MFQSTNQHNSPLQLERNPGISKHRTLNKLSNTSGLQFFPRGENMASWFREVIRFIPTLCMNRYSIGIFFFGLVEHKFLNWVRREFEHQVTIFRHKIDWVGDRSPQSKPHIHHKDTQSAAHVLFFCLGRERTNGNHEVRCGKSSGTNGRNVWENVVSFSSESFFVLWPSATQQSTGL